MSLLRALVGDQCAWSVLHLAILPALHPGHLPTVPQSWRGRVSYEHEHDEWGRAVRGMSEMQRAATEVELRHAAGLCGDQEDARDE